MLSQKRHAFADRNYSRHAESYQSSIPTENNFRGPSDWHARDNCWHPVTQVAELGYEVAASNAAFLLDRWKIRLDGGVFQGKTWNNRERCTQAGHKWKDLSRRWLTLLPRATARRIHHLSGINLSTHLKLTLGRHDRPTQARILRQYGQKRCPFGYTSWQL